MKSSNRSPASQAPTKNTQNDYSVLIEVRNELEKAFGLTKFYEVWVKKCYDIGKRRPERSIQNAIRILSKKAIHHLQRAIAIAEHTSEKSGTLHETLEFMEADMLIVSDPLLEVSERNVLALLSVIDEFSWSAGYVSEVLEEEIKKHESSVAIQQDEFVKTQVDFSSVDPIDPLDYAMPSVLDLCYAEIYALSELLHKDDGEALSSNHKTLRDSLIKTSFVFKGFLSSDIDNYLRKELETALNHIDFIVQAFEKILTNKTANKYRWSISRLLSETLITLSEATITANRHQVREILKGGVNVDNSLH